MQRKRVAMVAIVLLCSGCGSADNATRSPTGVAGSTSIVRPVNGTGSGGQASGVAGALAGTSGAGENPKPGTGGAGTGGVTGTAGITGIAGITGSAGVTGTAGVTGAAGSPPTGGKDPRMPMKPATCPTIATGMIQVLGQSVQLWVGTKQATKGPIVFYWHGTGSNSGEAASGLGAGNSEIMAQGGVIASFTTTTKTGTDTGNGVWYTGDFEMADQILACAIEQQNIDPRKVYTAGCSAGGLQAGAMVYGRSSYLAAAMPNSGGSGGRPVALEDPTHVPAIITTHGAMGSDVVGVEFTTTSLNECKDIKAKGGFAVDCDHGGGHCQSPPAVKNAQWQFLKDHPFGVMPEPYAAGLPASFPAFCKIIM